MHKIVDGQRVALTEAEITEFNTRAAAWEAGATDRKAAKVRAERDRLLAETDWRFRSDLTPSQEWIDYCQALRDVPAQEGFPENVTWPTKPE